MNGKLLRGVFAPVALAVLAMGCPSGGNGQAQYDAGFEDGFALDEWYWEGYFDGWDTINETPVFYQGGEIPYYESPAYDAGYWDGVWYAYNDGYFVDYLYAFAIGFSEGYDNAFYSDYLDFLDDDEHFEVGNGGWADGYHDGYTEGRVFGAYDYEANLPFDWLDALLDYESGTDLYFEEVDVGTGAYGPMIPYQYGTDPTTKQAAAARLARGLREPLTLRRTKGAKVIDLDSRILFRELDSQAEDDLDYEPDESLRDPTPLRLGTTWLERIEDYLAAYDIEVKQVRAAR